MTIVVTRYRQMHVGRRIGNFITRWAGRVTYAACLVGIGFAIRHFGW